MNGEEDTVVHYLCDQQKKTITACRCTYLLVDPGC